MLGWVTGVLMGFVCAAGACWPGVARRQPTCSLLRQRKVGKERRPGCLGPCASLRATCGGRQKRGSTQTRLRLKQRAALIPLLPATTGPARTGLAGADAGQVQLTDCSATSFKDWLTLRRWIPGRAREDTAFLLLRTRPGRVGGLYIERPATTERGHAWPNVRRALVLPLLPLGEGVKTNPTQSTRAFNPDPDPELAPNPAPRPPLLSGPAMPRKNGIRAARCLSAASLRRPPFLRGSAGRPKRSVGTQTAGSPFLCLLSFGEAKAK